MTLTLEEWQKLECQSEGKYRVLIHRDVLRSQFENQQSQVVQSVKLPPDWELLRELDWGHRRKGNMRILYEESSFLVGGQRDLEDLILACVDAGINIDEYL